jgi:excisionase family DNA binding protein
MFVFTLDLMTPQEAADALRVSTATVRRWAREGTIPSVRLGDGRAASVRIPRDGLRNALAARSGGREVR